MAVAIRIPYQRIANGPNWNAMEPGASPSNLEAPEAADLHLVAPGKGSGDGLEDRVDDGLAVLFRQRGHPGQLVDQIRARHIQDSIDTIVSALPWLRLPGTPSL